MSIDKHRCTDPMRDWRLLRSEQHDIVTRIQLRRQGFTDHAIVANIAAGRWRKVHRGVIATVTGPLTRPAVLAAALAYAGDPAILSHRTAAEQWGWQVADGTEPIHVTVPYHHSAVSQPSVVVHRSRAFEHIILADALPPRTSRIDTLLDLAVAEPTPERAVRTLLNTAAVARASAWRILERMQVRRPYRYEKPLLRAAEQFAEGLCSVLEVRYALDVEQAHGIPQATRQVPVVVDGTTLWEDCSYERAGVPLLVRLDGRAFHSAHHVAFRDRRRDNAAEIAGRPRLVYGWDEVHRDPCGVAREVLTVLRREGWQGPVRLCPSPRCREYFLRL